MGLCHPTHSPAPPGPDTHEQRGRAERLYEQARTLLSGGDQAQALMFFVEQEPLWREVGDRPALAQSLAGRAVALIGLKRHQEALAPLRDAAAIWRDLGNRDQLRRILATQGSTLQRLGRNEEALAAWREEEEHLSARCRTGGNWRAT